MFYKTHFIVMKNYFSIISVLFWFGDYHLKMIIMDLKEIFFNKCNLVKLGSRVHKWWWCGFVFKTPYMAMLSRLHTTFYDTRFLRSISVRS
jgi:hypothetical protein